MFSNLLFLLGSPAGAGNQQSGSPLASLAPLILIGVIMYFLMIRPQSKKQKAMRNMLSNIRKGDAIITIGGIHGVISEVKEKTIIVKVDDNTKLEFNRESIASVVIPKEQKEVAVSTEDTSTKSKSGKSKSSKSGKEKKEDNK